MCTYVTHSVGVVTIRSFLHTFSATSSQSSVGAVFFSAYVQQQVNEMLIKPLSNTTVALISNNDTYNLGCIH